jgi:polyprenyldihydroxybenzoate methyltransferase/3-demethylubiquinol 3-O-methyltransferase
MNPVRMEFVRNKVVSAREDDDGWSLATRKEARNDFGQSWLEGMDVLDVGCGGGLMSEVYLQLERWQIHWAYNHFIHL